MSFYSFMRGSLRFIMTKVIFPTRVSGAQEPLPEGPAVLCANHISAADVILLIGCTGRQISFMAKKELFGIPLIGGLLKKMGAFPVQRGMMDVAAVKKAISVVENGGMLGIFPQGTRCPGVEPDRTFDKLHDGAVMIAQRAHAVILPVAIKTKNQKLRPFKRVEVIYGRPIPFEEYDALIENKDYGRATARVFEAICALHKKEN